MILTLEEHQIAGGLGSAVAEYYASTTPKRVERMGVTDQFGQSGTMDELLAHYGMDTASVMERIKSLVT
jgi:transketolase